MQINVDVHNYMETIVSTILQGEEYLARYTSDQLADLTCLSLNQLRPLYIRHDIDFLCNLPENRRVLYQNQAMAAITASETMLQDERRKDRSADDDYVVYKELDRKDDNELEWYEQPILQVKNDKK